MSKVLSIKMVVIGLTGGSGCGKGYICKIFSDFGIKSADADKIYHDIVSIPDSPCLAELSGYFGSEILKPDGSLNRSKLSQIVFASGAEKKLKYLNETTHKYVLNDCRKWPAERKANGDEIALIDAPMLFESGFDKECDFVISIIADYDQRVKRLKERDGITETQIKARINVQHTDNFFKDNSDYIILNNDGLDIRGQISEILHDIRHKTNGTKDIFSGGDNWQSN